MCLVDLVLRLNRVHILCVLFLESSDFRMKLIDLISCIGCQTLNLISQALDFFLQLLYGGFELSLGVFSFTSGRFESILQLLNFLL